MGKSAVTNAIFYEISTQTFHFQKRQEKQFVPPKGQHRSNPEDYKPGHKGYSDNRQNNKPTEKFKPGAQYRKNSGSNTFGGKTTCSYCGDTRTNRAFPVQSQSLNAKSTIKLDTSPVVVSWTKVPPLVMSATLKHNLSQTMMKMAHWCH